jgi:hypothetical protein
MGIWPGKMAWICGPHVAAEALGLDRAEHNRDVEHLRGFQKRNVIVDNRLTVEIGDTKKHLRLQIDNRDHTVLGRQ